MSLSFVLCPTLFPCTLPSPMCPASICCAGVLIVLLGVFPVWALSLNTEPILLILQQPPCVAKYVCVCVCVLCVCVCMCVCVLHVGMSLCV